MRFDPRVAEWASFASDPGFNLAEKSLKMAQLLQYPDLDVDAYVRKIRVMGCQFRERAGGADDAEHAIHMLNRHIFDDIGFSVSGDRILGCGFLNDVIDGKAGHQLAMAVLYMEIAKFAGLWMSMDGISDGMGISCGDLHIEVKSDGSRRMLRRPGAAPALAGISGIAAIMRLMGHAYVQTLDLDRALRCARMILSVDPTPRDVRICGLVLGALGDCRDSVKMLEGYLESGPDADDAEHILRIIEQQRERISDGEDRCRPRP